MSLSNTSYDVVGYVLPFLSIVKILKSRYVLDIYIYSYTQPILFELRICSAPTDILKRLNEGINTFSFSM